MQKFKVLQSNQRFTSSILRIDIEQKRNPWMRSIDKFFTSIPVQLILFILFSILISGAVRVHNKSYDFTVRLAAILGSILMLQAFTVFLDMGVNMQKIATLYQKLQAIVDGVGMAFLCLNSSQNCI